MVVKEPYIFTWVLLDSLLIGKVNGLLMMWLFDVKIIKLVMTNSKIYKHGSSNNEP